MTKPLSLAPFPLFPSEAGPKKIRPDRLIIFDLQFSLHFSDRNPGLRSGHSENQLEPLKRGGDFIEDRSCCYGNLFATLHTFIQQPCGNQAILLMSAERTRKTFRPSGFKDPLITIFLVFKLLLKKQQVHILIFWFVFIQHHSRKYLSIYGEQSQLIWSSKNRHLVKQFF